MSEKVTGLTSRQRKAIEALLENKTITQASTHAGVSRKTIVNSRVINTTHSRLGVYH